MAAPTKLVLDFLHAVGENEYDLALRIVEQVLQFEPRNSLMIEYKSVLERAIKVRDEEAIDVEDETDDDNDGFVVKNDSDEDSDDDGEDDGDDEASGDDGEDDGDDEDSSDNENEEDENQQTRAETTNITLDEIQEDLENFGLEGTREELVNNLRWIVQNSPCNGRDATTSCNLGVEAAEADSKVQDAK